MKRIILFILISVFISCKGKNKSVKTDQDKTPTFIQKHIEIYKNENDAKHWPVITRYTYNNAFVYYFKMPCCDQLNVLYDEQGRELCKPDGGITGKGDGRCSDFFASKKDPKQIWPEVIPKYDPKH